MSEDFTQRATCECYYKFENASDLGEDNQGQIALTNNNGVSQSSTIPSGTYANPSATKSADFDKASIQYFSASHNDAQEIDNLTAFTALMWIKNDTNNSHHMLWNMSNYGGDGHECLLNYVGKTQFKFAGTLDEEAFSWTTGVWYFLAFTYSQTSDAMRTYRGNEETQVVQIGSDTEAINKTGGTAKSFTIGRHNLSADYYHDGLICEIAFFSEELSLAELQEIQADGVEGGVAGQPTQTRSWGIPTGSGRRDRPGGYN
jgi:hypothetical protein